MEDVKHEGQWREDMVKRCAVWNVPWRACTCGPNGAQLVTAAVCWNRCARATPH